MPPAPPQKFHKVRNEDKVEKLVIVGSEFDLYQAKRGMGKGSLQPVGIGIVDQHGKSIHNRTISAALKGLLDGADEKTIVISNVNLEHDCNFAAVGANVKAFSDGAAFALLSDEKKCGGLTQEMEEFAAKAGIQISLLKNIDYTFQFNNDYSVFRTIVTLHEDMMNFGSDQERAVLIVEDRPAYYTPNLISLYKEGQHRVRMLLARTFEEAEALINKAVKAGGTLAGVILDMEFPQAGKISKEASFMLYDMIKAADSKTKVVFQSLNHELLSKASKLPMAIAPLDKTARNYLPSLRSIFRDRFGFGDFVFLNPQTGKELGERASSPQQLFEIIHTVDAKSLLYHASLNDFSNWLWMHGLRDASREIKPVDEQNPRILRETLINFLKPYIKQKKEHP